MDTGKQTKTYKKRARAIGTGEMLKNDRVICFICHKMVDLEDTIELDHATGKFKVRVCKKHLEV